MESHCSVCIEPYKGHRKCIVCLHCNLECCTICATTYLENSVLTPQCMQCHNIWSHQYVRENFGCSFIKKMENVRKSVLFNEQQTFFPHTQEYVSLINRLEMLENRNERCSRDWWRERYHLRERIRQIRYPIRGLDNYPGEYNDTVNTIPKKVYIKPCGQAECKGYVNASSNTCELCNAKYCSKCMEEMLDNHTCEPENIATVSMLRKDTKGCPKCAVPIHRISGCPDMFCVSCNTAFNWNTLKINERGNSNPHYYQWLRSNNTTSNQNPNDCGRHVDIRLVFRSTNFMNLDETQRDAVHAVLNMLHHYEQDSNVSNYYKMYNTTKRYNHGFQIVTMDKRANFMKNKLSKDQFTQYLLKTNKAMEFNTHMSEILQSIRLFSQHLMHMVVYNSTFDYHMFMIETKNFVEYINQCVSTLEAVFYSAKKTKFFVSVCYKRYLANVPSLFTTS